MDKGEGVREEFLSDGLFPWWKSGNSFQGKMMSTHLPSYLNSLGLEREGGERESRYMRKRWTKIGLELSFDLSGLACLVTNGEV